MQLWYNELMHSQNPLLRGRHKLIRFIVLCCILTAFFVCPTFAATDGIVETTFFGNLKDDGSGCGVYTILNLVIDILSIGVGILAIIGITIAGIKYLTAKDNIEQTKKAKTRLLQIVLGLVTYALLYAGIQWLLPGGKLNFSQQCTTVSDQELAAAKEQESPSTSSGETSSSDGDSGATETTKGDATCLKNAIKIVKDAGICEAKTAAERIARTAELLAWPKGTSSKVYSQKPTAAYEKAIAETMTFPKSQQKYKWTKGRSCSVFVATVVRASGYDKSFAGAGSVASINTSAKNSQKWQKVSPSKAVRGDIFAYKDNHHVMIYGGKQGSKYVWYQADKGDYYGYTSYGDNPANKKNVNVWHAVENTSTTEGSSSGSPDVEGATKIGERMIQAADEAARYFADNKFIYFQYDPSNGYSNPYIRKGYGPYEGESLTWERAKRVRYSHCSSFATLVQKKAGLLPDQQKYHSYIYKGSINFKNAASKQKILQNFKIVHGNGAKLQDLVKNKKIAPGDIFGYPGITHTMIFAGKNNGKYYIYEVSAPNNQILKYKGNKRGYIYTTISGSKKIGDILHAK